MHWHGVIGRMTRRINEEAALSALAQANRGGETLTYSRGMTLKRTLSTIPLSGNALLRTDK